MKTDLYAKFVLSLIAVLLVYEAFVLRPPSVQAQTQIGYYRLETIRTSSAGFIENRGAIVGTCPASGGCLLILH
jgi:hypothetical protein